MGHWYRQDGQTQYTVPRADGKGERDTTLRDARKLNLVPSVTTIIGTIDKPGLTTWKLQQLMDACCEWPYTDDQSVVEWKRQVTLISEQITKESSIRGSRIHDKLEQCYKGDTPEEDKDITIPVLDRIREEIGEYDWIAEASFSKHGYGGKVDLHTKDGKGIFIDFKTKNTDDVKKMVAYDEHAMQLAAYRIGLDLPEALCYNVFISTKQPGLITIKKWKEEDIVRGYKMFQCLYSFWCLQNRFGE